MDDLISRQWLMECVNEGWIQFDTEKDENRFMHLVRDIAPSAQPYTEAEIQKIQDLEQAEIQKAYELGKLEAEQRWIPCSERLPETSGTYLVSGMWASGRVAVGDCEYSSYDGYFNTAWNFDVIAWCELPEPYRGEGENR